jgi:hypothetical protein
MSPGDTGALLLIKRARIVHTKFVEICMQISTYLDAKFVRGFARNFCMLYDERLALWPSFSIRSRSPSQEPQSSAGMVQLCQYASECCWKGSLSAN